MSQSLIAIFNLSLIASQQGNDIKLSRYTVLFAPGYLPASETEEHPHSKKNNFARWLYFVLLGSGSPAPGVRGFARLHFLNGADL
jgi:hypothetical protein